MRLSAADAHVLASRLELDYETVPICLACLTVVSFPLDLGEERKARREAAAFAPHFWEEGLADSLRSGLRTPESIGPRRRSASSTAWGSARKSSPRSSCGSRAPRSTR